MHLILRGGMRPEVCHNVWKGKPEEQERNIPLDYPWQISKNIVMPPPATALTALNGLNALNPRHNFLQQNAFQLNKNWDFYSNEKFRCYWAESHLQAQFKISHCTGLTSSSLVWYLVTLPKQHFAWKFILQCNGPKPGEWLGIYEI